MYQNKEEMGYCRSYKTECPFALSESAPVPCIGDQKQCDEVRGITKIYPPEKDTTYYPYMGGLC